MNILLIQNDMKSAIRTIELIISWGYQTTLATNGKEALLRIEHWNFDLILLDLQLTDISVELFIKDIKIITMLDKSTPDMEKMIRSLGIAYYLSTQYVPSELKSIIKHIAQKSTKIF